MTLHNPNNWHWINKEVGPWAKQWLQDNLTKLEAEDGGVSAKISKVVSMDGDVEVFQKRGKVGTIFDVKLVLEYSGNTVDKEHVSGTITVPEVAYDTEEDEYVFEITIHAESRGKQPVKDLVRSKLVPQLRAEFAKLAPALIAEQGKDIQHPPGSNLSSGVSTPNNGPRGSSTPATTSQAGAAGTTAQGGDGATLRTTTIKDSAEFRMSAEQIYEIFTNRGPMETFTKATVPVFEGAQPGCKFELSDGKVKCEFKELEKPKRIVHTWREAQWPSGHFSTLTLDFDQNNVDNVTVVKFSWRDVPENDEDSAKTYIRRIKGTFAPGPSGGV